MKRRMVAATMLVTAVAVTLLGVPLAVAASRLYLSRAVARLEGEAAGAGGATAATTIETGGAPTLGPPSKDMRLAVYDAAGRRVAGEGPDQAGPEVRAALRGAVAHVRDGAWLSAAVPVHDEDAVVGAVRAATAWDAVADRTHKAWLAMLGLGAVALVVAGGLARRQAARLAAPIGELAAGAVRLGQGDFGVRLDPSGFPELDAAVHSLNRTAARLGELMSRERRFSADASHQLVTPLTSLRVGLESALLTDGVDARTAMLEAIEEVERLERTVSTLLSLARDAPDRERSCNVAEAAGDAAAHYRDVLARAGRPLRVEIEGPLPAARCSHEVLREILGVLVDNAVRHGAGAVAVRARRAGAGLVLEVEDGGPGVGDRSTLFERRAPGAAGHGIGLALARSLAEAHGARLELTRAGPGPVFAIALPGGEAPEV